MKLFLTFILALTLVISNVIPVFAQDTPTPTPQIQIQYTNEFSVQNEPSSIITLLKNFVNGFDTFLGGFIFYTPDPLAKTIVLKDKSEIPGVTKYRDIFYQIALPILAIIIAGIAISKLGSDNAQQLKSFFFRLLIVIVLFITVPPMLSYSIQFNNLLVEKISTTQNFTGFLNDYFDKSQQAISTNSNPSETFGIPSFDISLKSGIFYSLGKFIVQLLLFALTFIFLLCGFIYIGFQFVIRFASLLFLGVIYPVVLPFALSERTQNIVYTYFKSWFTFLIEQAAFVLGFSIATDIFTSILNAKGPSVGMLFFYTGFLFFLGSVNVMVARIFGDVWTAMSGNMYAALSYRAVSKPVTAPIGNFTRGFIGGNVSTIFGQKARNLIQAKKQDESGNIPTADNGSSNSGQKTTNVSSNPTNINKVTATTVPPFSQNLAAKGLKIEAENPKQGVVSVTGDTYKYEDKKSGLISFYPTRTEAVADGVPEERLQKTSFDHNQFIDLSSFNKTNPNPHNFNAMEEAKKQGKELNYAFIKESSPPQRVKHFLELSKTRNEAYGVQGVIVERQAKKGTDPVIRIYSHKSYEKRKNIQRRYSGSYFKKSVFYRLSFSGNRNGYHCFA
jgi:hypothetical protein